MTLIFVLILAIPSFFISRWALKRLDIGTHKNRNYIALFPALILSLFLYIGLLFLWFATSSYYPSNEFNTHDWKTNIEERYTLSEDLIDSKILIGKTKSETSVLLGTDFYAYNNNHISYTLGFVPGLFNIDPDVLDIYFENGKVVKVSQHKN